MGHHPTRRASGACVLLVLAAWLPWAPVRATEAVGQPATLTRLPKPRQESRPGCERAGCVPLGAGAALCQCADSGGPDNRAGYSLVYERAGKLAARWPSRGFMGDVTSFEVLRGDLDSNGRNEIIVATLIGSSNGIAVDRYQIDIFPEAVESVRPLEFTVEDYGEGTFVQRSGERFVRILATEWVWSQDPKRGPGLYFVGRWFRYESGRLAPVGDPVLARRFLYGFERQRRRSCRGGRYCPLKWLSAPKTERRTHDPFASLPNEAEEALTVRSVAMAPATDDAEAKTLMLTLGRPDGQTVAPEVRLLSDRLGDEQTGLVYPLQYLPADLEHWLCGEQVHVMKTPDRTVLWVKAPGRTERQVDDPAP